MSRQRVRLSSLKFLSAGLSALLLLALAWPALHSWAEAFTRGLWFHLTDDEAFYAEVVENLRSRAFYGFWNGGQFSPSITGGPAFLLPTVLLAQLTGLNSAVAGRISTLLFHFGILLLILSWVGRSRRTAPHWAAGLLGVGVFFQFWRAMVESNYFDFGFLPESATVFYFILFLWSYDAWCRGPSSSSFGGSRFRGLPFWTGFTASLAVLAKPYLIFLPVALAVSLAAGLVLKPERRAATLRAQLPLWLGLATPWALWLSYMTFQLGLPGVWNYWLTYPAQVAALSGTGSPLGALAKAWLHLSNGGSVMNVRGWLLTALGLAVLLVAWLRRRSHPALVIFVVLHTTWWLFVNSSLVSRYFMPVMLIGMVALLRALLNLPVWIRLAPSAPKPLSRALVWVPPALLLALAAYRATPDWRRLPTNYAECAFCRQVLILDQWKALLPAQRPARIWIATGDTSSDRDQLFTAPRTLERITRPDEVTRIQPGDWASVSDYTESYFREWVNSHCQPKITPPGRSEGLWGC